MARVSTEERQEQIVNEAIKIIHEKGYGALSIRELSRRVGITEPGIYRHFTSKDEIISGILNRMVEFGKTLQQRLQEEANPKLKIKKLIDFHLDFLEKNKEMTSVIFSEDIFDPSETVKQKLHTIMQSRFRMLSEIIDQAKQQNLVVDADTTDLSTVILGYIRMVVLEWRNSGFSYSLQERGQRVIQTLEKIIFRNDS